MITTANYSTAIKSVNISSAPEALQKGHSFYERSNGSSKYPVNELYLQKLNEWAKKQAKSPTEIKTSLKAIKGEGRKPNVKKGDFVNVDFRKEYGIVQGEENTFIQIRYPDLGFTEAVDWRFVTVTKIAKPKPAKKQSTGSKTTRLTAKEQLAKQQTELQAFKTQIEEAKKGGLSKTELVRIAQKINSTRRLASQMIDGAANHSKILAPTEDNLRRWAANPGKYDFSGVDTKSKDTPPNKDFKKAYAPKKQTWFEKFWHGKQD